MLLTCKTGRDHICEQRNTEVNAEPPKSLKPPHSKNATRCESLLNALL